MREDLKKHFVLNDLDKIAFDFYLGGDAEKTEEWFERVFIKCEMYQKNNGFDENGNKLPRAYAMCPHEAWENKKKKRRKAIIRELLGKECHTEEEETQALQDCLLHKNYNTRCERTNQIKLEREQKAKEKQEKRKSELMLLQKKLDNETIAALRPDLKSLIEELDGGIVTRTRVGKV